MINDERLMIKDMEKQGLRKIKKFEEIN